MTASVDALIGLAQLMEDAGLGAWSTTGTYGPSDTAIVVGRLPLKPLKAIALTPYRVQGALPDSLAGIWAVQVRMRCPGADLRPLMDLQEKVANLLDYRGPTVLGGQYFAQIWCQISTPPGSLGTDDLPELADTYYLRTDR